MLWTIFVILLVLWLLGLVTSYTLGGFIHILLVIAIVVVLIRVRVRSALLRVPRREAPDRRPISLRGPAGGAGFFSGTDPAISAADV